MLVLFETPYEEKAGQLTNALKDLGALVDLHKFHVGSLASGTGVLTTITVEDATDLLEKRFGVADTRVDLSEDLRGTRPAWPCWLPLRACTQSASWGPLTRSASALLGWLRTQGQSTSLLRVDAVTSWKRPGRFSRSMRTIGRRVLANPAQAAPAVKP